LRAVFHKIIQDKRRYIFESILSQVNSFQSSSSRGRGPFPSSSKEEEKTPSAPTDATPAMKALFLNDNVSLQDHLDNQNKDYNLYTSVLVLLINQGVEISKASRPRILAAAYSRKDKELPEYLLRYFENSPNFLC
jgi:hypothetical protein